MALQGHEDFLLPTDGRRRLRKGAPGLPSKLLLFVTGMSTVTVAMVMGTVVVATATGNSRCERVTAAIDSSKRFQGLRQCSQLRR